MGEDGDLGALGSGALAGVAAGDGEADVDLLDDGLVVVDRLGDLVLL